MVSLEGLKEKVLRGEKLSKEEACTLIEADIDKLSNAANEIRKAFCGNNFDMCAVINVKGGRCSENCKFCSQASCSEAIIPSFEVRDADHVGKDARRLSGKGIAHYCQVSSGRRISKKEIGQICENIKEIVQTTDLLPCVSLGLVDEEDLIRLKEAGVRRVHNNLETSREFFPKVCTSHTYDEKIEVIRNIHKTGLELCCGGIFGIGESWDDRIEMALTLREFHPQSVPINMLKPVKGTFMGDYTPISESEVRRIIAIYRFLLPHAYIRLAAGRDYLPDTGLSCFESGCNSAITGDMVTVKGISIEEDLVNIAKMGYNIPVQHM